MSLFELFELFAGPRRRGRNLSEALDALDALSVSVEDADAQTPAEQALFGEPGMPPPKAGWERSRIVRCLPPKPWRAMRPACWRPGFFRGLRVVAIQPVPEQDWVRLTQSQFAPVDITPEFWIVPTWHEPPAEAKQVIRLDPGLAFGTGTHPTTRMCLRWIAGRAGQDLGRVLDYGCGSGILAIGAAKFGATDIDAVDIDPPPWSRHARQCRGQPCGAQCGLARKRRPGQYRTVLANILATPLKVLAPLLCAHVEKGGHLVLAGILDRQAEELKEAYAPYRKTRTSSMKSPNRHPRMRSIRRELRSRPMPQKPPHRRRPKPFRFLCPTTASRRTSPGPISMSPSPHGAPPPSTLPPFPNIDLNLAAPPPTARSSPPPPLPPLPFTPRVLKTRALIQRASDDKEEEQEQDEKDHDQVQMQKALRRSRAKSAKIAGAKAREERAAAKAAEASVVQVASEPDYALSAPFEPPLGHPFADEEESSEASPPSFWQRKSVRAVLVLLALLAVALLVVQVLRHERDGIAARQPNLRPALAVLCQYTGCELAALRRIGDIVIDGAAFAREKSGVNDYRLSFTLRNGATVPLAMPAIELSLLDTQERAVVRRVLTPADYGAPAVLQARSDRAASLPLSLSASEAAALPPIAGYRVEAFYP
jgi:ribosomal protein L11 methylase PrmA